MPGGFSIYIANVSGSMMNTGHSVIFTVDNDTCHHINVTGGPLSYKYQFQEIHIHYGLHDQFGSEHSINGYAFPAEVGNFGKEDGWKPITSMINGRLAYGDRQWRAHGGWRHRGPGPRPIIEDNPERHCLSVMLGHVKW
ncbi:hypothetical protein NQ317_005951 [Molorchus minor]|uniref:Alpha-carbonic anhydrase domain-containing protein n=1 Tax=Molorchus minor TaxID=1323400 RepID=A0ABQ9JJJ6_9CUCU|nr:hypothetical protein NQ317_005951 [Molorchus minor]